MVLFLTWQRAVLVPAWTAPRPRQLLCCLCCPTLVAAAVPLSAVTSVLLWLSNEAWAAHSACLWISLEQSKLPPGAAAGTGDDEQLISTDRGLQEPGRVWSWEMLYWDLECCGRASVTPWCCSGAGPVPLVPSCPLSCLVCLVEGVSGPRGGRLAGWGAGQEGCAELGPSLSSRELLCASVLCSRDTWTQHSDLRGANASKII